MTSATVSKLKASLGEYLPRVEAGEEMPITEGWCPAAKPTLEVGARTLPDHLAAMKKEGLVKRGSARLPENSRTLPRPRAPKGSIERAALRDREEGWRSSGTPPRSFPCARASPALLRQGRFSRKTHPMAVWWATRTECVSALMRAVREGGLGAAVERQAREVLARSMDTWTEIQPSKAIRENAARLLAVPPLRAADAFQLAAALIGCQGRPAGMPLVSCDARLRDTAHEGTVHPSSSQALIWPP